MRKQTEAVLNKNNWFANLPKQKKTILAKYAQLRIGQNFVEQNLKQAYDIYSNFLKAESGFSQNLILREDVNVLGGFHLHLLVFPCCYQFYTKARSRAQL